MDVLDVLDEIAVWRAGSTSPGDGGGGGQLLRSAVRRWGCVTGEGGGEWGGGVDGDGVGIAEGGGGLGS